MYGIHGTTINNYGSYFTFRLNKRGKARIWLDKLPDRTATQVICLKCNKLYFIKYKIWNQK